METFAAEPAAPGTSQPQLAHRLIASDRVEGTAVCRADTGAKIGRIERLMIDKITGQVAYAVMTFGGFLGFGQKHYPIPWNALKYDTRWEAYVTELTAEQLKDAPAYDDSFDWGDRRGQEVVNDFYRRRGYWG
jgi:hypothetical protein